MRKMKIVLLKVAALILTACGGISKTVDMNYGESYKIEEEKLEGKNDVVWESEDNSIVTVSDDGTVTAKAPGKVKVSIKEGDKSLGTYTFNVTTVPIEQIIFAADSVEITDKTGNNVNKYTLLPKDASDYGITWTSADESVAIVNDKGEVEAKSEGKTVIIATAENGVSAQYSVEVTPMSVWQQLTADEKSFVNDVVPATRIKETAMAKNNDVNDEEMTVELELEDGTTVNCAIVTILTVDSKEYIALLPINDEGENEDGEDF